MNFVTVNLFLEYCETFVSLSLSPSKYIYKSSKALRTVDKAGNRESREWERGQEVEEAVREKLRQSFDS